eukprot:7714798-Pyramimonas_sp.AAC.1
MGGSNAAPAPGVPAHKARKGTAPALSLQQAGVYCSRAGTLLCCAQNRADCQCEVSLLGRMPSGPA